MLRRMVSTLFFGAVVVTVGCEDTGPTSPDLAVDPVFAHHPTGAWSYFFVEVPGMPSAIAKNGDQIDIGVSTFDEFVPTPFTLHSKTIDGSGDFTITSTAGGPYVGTWTATKLISFSPIGRDGDLFGGRLIFEIELTGASGTHKAIVKLTCTDFGGAPPGTVQGMTLKIVGGQRFTGAWGVEAGTEGFTFFLLES